MLKINKKLSKKGFSLIELMVAVAILAVAVFGIFHAYSTGFWGMTDAKYRTIATNIAREKMEEIKNKSFVESSTYVENVSGKQFTTKVKVTQVESNLCQVITTVNWLNRKGEQKEVKLEMLVYDLQTSTSPLEVGSIYLSADPTEVTCCIGDTSTITAVVYDTEGNLVPYGTMVSFTTTSGTLSADSAPTSGGIATVTLTLEEDDTTATVTAFIGAVSDTVDITCTAPNINIAAVPSALTICETSTITATLTDNSGNPVANQVVVFYTDKGVLSSDSAVTNESGEALVTLTSDDEGVATVEASFCENTSTITVNFTTPIITVSADPPVIALDTTTTSTITAKVTDSLNNPVKNQMVEFTTDDGILNGGNNTALVPTDNDGMATVELSNTSIGKARVQASYCSVTGIVEVVTKPISSVYYLIVSASPQEIEADGSSTSTITAILYDPEDQPVADYLIDFSADYGTLSAPSATTNDEGEATVILTSSTTAVESTVTASTTPPIGDPISGNTTVTFYSSDPDHIELIANPILVSGGRSDVTAIIKRGNKIITNYVGSVDFSIVAGGRYAYFLGSNPVDVSNGRATRTLATKWYTWFPMTLVVKASTSFVNASGETVTLEEYLDVPVVRIIIQLTDPPEVNCDLDVGCKKIYFDVEVLGVWWGERYLTVQEMKVTWPSGLLDSSEVLTRIGANRSGWNPAWSGNATAGTVVPINQRLYKGLHTIDLSFNIDMSGKTIEVIFYTNVGDFLVEIVVP